MSIGIWRRLRNRTQASPAWREDSRSPKLCATSEESATSHVVSNAPRDIPPEAFNDILQAHQSWLKSKGQNGQRADLSQAGLVDADLPGANLEEANLQNAELASANLSGANLSRANLSGANLERAVLRGTNLSGALFGKANLQRADLSGANLEEASLGGANLQHACLAHAQFRDANLHQARFWGADLRDTDLADVHDLSGAQLAGTNVAGAKLPVAIARFDGLLRARESAEIARPMFILMLLGCLYAFATITSTTDAALLANFPSEFLPDVSVPIPTVWFFFAMPFILFSIYVYLNLYIEEIWRAISDLPSVFPDGTDLHRMIYPWLLMRLLSRAVSGHSVVRGDDISFTRAATNTVFVFLVWWLVPILLLLFGARYLPAHDWMGTSVHIALFVLAVGSGGIGIHSFGTAQIVRRSGKHRTFTLKGPLHGVVNSQITLAIAMGLIFLGLSYGAIKGIPHERAALSDARTWVSRVLSFVGYNPFGDFSDMDISIRPIGWREGDVDSVKRADLRGRDLRYLEAPRAFLASADFREADLYGAVLVGAYLEGADLRDAKLELADLSKAKLRLADLRRANLRGANLRQVRLQEANLAGADLQMVSAAGATLSDASLVGARLQGADLLDADLRGADLSGADLKQAVLRLADLRRAVLTDAGLARAVLGAADLRDAVLTGAQLQEADLSGADLSGADLTRADMESATFIGAKLRKALLRKARLVEAQMTNADLVAAAFRLAELEGAVFRFADLRLANFGGAMLHGADFVGTQLQGADLRSIKGQEADFGGANLRGTILRLAHLQHAHFAQAILQKAQMGGANLEAADFSSADLREADLRSAKLQNANLEDADLMEANLTGAKLTGADLGGANLIGVTGLAQSQLDQACGGDKTALPSGFTIRPC